jgi:hypothetical protein
MTVTSFDVVFYTLAFIVPGFIWSAVIGGFVPRRADQKEVVLLRFLTFSCMNYAFWSWLIYLIIKRNLAETYLFVTAFLWFMIIFVSPLVMGIISGVFSQREFVRRVLWRLGIAILHPIPMAWDYQFSRVNPCWIMVTLKDGSSISGFFGSNSFASSIPEERDIYIETMYGVSEDGPWKRVERSEGILVRGDQIKTIEFWKSEGECKHERANRQAATAGGLSAKASCGSR